MAGALIALASLINLGLNLLLIPRFSIYGAAIGTLISQVIFFVLIYLAAQRWYKIPYELSRIALITGVGMALVVAAFFLNNAPLQFGCWQSQLFCSPFLLSCIWLDSTTRLKRRTLEKSCQAGKILQSSWEHKKES